MKVMDWREIALDQGIVREPESDESRLIVWLPVEDDGDFRCWERIGNVARGEIAVEDGICSTPATAIRARRRARGLLGKLRDRFGEGKGKRSFAIPGGETVEQHGDRAVDCLLAWPDEPGEDLDEERVRARWPGARRHRRLGPRLFLVEGVAARGATENGLAPAAATPQDGSPRKQAEEVLAAARRRGDRVAEVTAMTDLAIIIVSEGKPREAIPLFEQALTLARSLGDAARESDIKGNLGLALLHVQQPAAARPLFEQEMNQARTTGDVMAEKLAVERMGLAASVMGDPRGAYNWFERGLTLTRKVGDQQQEANLLWLQAIQLAEMDQRDAAIERGQEAIALFSKLGRPQAGWYGAYLQKYRMGLFDAAPAPAAAGVATGPGSFLGGSLVAGVMAAQPAAQGQAQAQANPKATTGPGLLRMALSATKSMAQFAGTGFKLSPPELQRRRIETCAPCEHHTGMRCKICGCFTGAKSRLLHESCPIGKWPA